MKIIFLFRSIMGIYIFIIVFYINNYATIDEYITTTIQVGKTPTFMALSPSGDYLYVVNNGQEIYNNQGSISIIKTSTNLVVDSILLDIGFPDQIAITPDGMKAYIAISKAQGYTISTGSSRVDVIDLSNNTIIHSILFNADYFGPNNLVISPDGAYVYVSSRGAQEITVIDVSSDTIITTIPVGGDILGIDITPDGSRIYTASRSNSIVYVIDTNTNTVLTTIQLTLNSSTSSTSIAISPDGSIGYVSYVNTDSLLAIIDTDPNSPNYNQEIGTIKTTSDSLFQIVFTDDGKKAFVAGGGSNEMLIIDSDKNSPTYNKQVGTVKVGEKPYDVKFQPLSIATAYVSNSNDGTVSVIGNNLVGIKNNFHKIPEDFILHQNYPNPFNSTTIIEFNIMKYCLVDLTVYNILGEKIKTLVNSNLLPGTYKINWNATDEHGFQLSSGIYLCCLKVGTESQIKKMILVK